VSQSLQVHFAVCFFALLLAAIEMFKFTHDTPYVSHNKICNKNAKVGF
jgi:hypothetical protein